MIRVYGGSDPNRGRVSEAILNRWQAAYGSMTRSAVKELQRLGEGNTRLKCLLGQVEMEKAVWKELLEGNFSARLAAMMPYGVWSSRAITKDWPAQIVGLSCSAYRRARHSDHRPNKYANLREWIHEFAKDHHQWGHRCAWITALTEGYGACRETFRTI